MAFPPEELTYMKLDLNLVGKSKTENRLKLLIMSLEV